MRVNILCIYLMIPQTCNILKNYVIKELCYQHLLFLLNQFHRLSHDFISTKFHPLGTMPQNINYNYSEYMLGHLMSKQY